MGRRAGGNITEQPGGGQNPHVIPGPKPRHTRKPGTSADEQRETPRRGPVYFARKYGVQGYNRELNVSGTGLGAGLPIPLGHCRVQGHFIASPTPSIAGGGAFLACIWQICEADSRATLEYSDVVIQDTSVPSYDGLNTGLDWLGYCYGHDGTQTALESNFLAYHTDWHYGCYGTAVVTAIFSVYKRDPGMPTMYAEIKTPVYTDWSTSADLDDLSATGVCTDTGGVRFNVTIDGEGTPDTYAWTKNGAGGASGVAITGSAQTLSDGVQITFAATTGHSSGDTWCIRPLSNPWMATYWVLTSERFGPAWADTRFDSSSWTTMANLCDVDPGDGTAQWAVNGAITGSTAADLVNQILIHCFGKMTPFGGVYYASQDRVLSSADATAGVGVWALGHEWSSRGISPQYNKASAIYTDTVNEWRQGTRIGVIAGTTAATVKELPAAQYPLCTNASQAQRTANQIVLTFAHENRMGNGAIHPGTGLTLLPGERLDVSTRTGHSGTSWRLERVQEDPDTGLIYVEGRLYSASALSTATSTENDDMSGGGQYASPDVPTAASQYLYETGTSDYVSPLADISYTHGNPASDTGPDHINSWTKSSITLNDTTLALNGIDYDLCRIETASLAATTGYTEYQFTPGSESYLVFHIAAFGSDSYGRTFYFEYVTDNGTQRSVALQPSAGFKRTFFQVAVDGNSPSWHRVRIRYSAGTSNGVQRLWARRIHVFPYSHDRRITFGERWEWTEDGSASTTVRDYVYGFEDSNDVFTASKSTPVGSTVMNIVNYSGGDVHDNIAYYGGLYESTMKASGHNGELADFPNPSQYFENIPYTAYSLTSFSELTISSGAITATGEYHELQPESSTSDDLDTISGLTGHAVLTLRTADVGDTITVKHATDNIYLDGDADCILSHPHHKIVLLKQGTDYVEISRANDTITPGPVTELTISSGAITAVGTYHALQPESGVSDDLDTINGLTAASLLILRTADVGDTITVKHATDNISLYNSSDCVLDHPYDRLVLQKHGSAFVEVSRQNNATDATTLGGVAIGSVIQTTGAQSKAGVLTLTDNPVISSAASNARVELATATQTWRVVDNNSNQRLTFVDVTNSKTPMSIEPNSATDTLLIGTSGIDVTGPVQADGLILDDNSEKTISGGVITVTAGFHTVDTEGDAASDNLDTINGMSTSGRLCYLAPADAARVVTITESGNCLVEGGTTLAIDTLVTCIYDSSVSKVRVR